MSTRKNPGAVEHDEESSVDRSSETVVKSGLDPVLDPVLDTVLDPDLDRVPSDELDGAEREAGSGDGSASDSVETSPDGKGGISKVKIVLGASVALVVAAVAVGVAGSLGGSDPAGLPETVGDPNVVIAALNEGGVECTGSAVSGQVATCNATVAVRVFDSTGEAETYVSRLVKDPLTSSAIGWVRHGNVVVASALTSTPEIAAALGQGSQIY